jgi:hypothetical protein
MQVLYQTCNQNLFVKFFDYLLLVLAAGIIASSSCNVKKLSLVTCDKYPGIVLIAVFSKLGQISFSKECQKPNNNCSLEMGIS